MTKLFGVPMTALAIGLAIAVAVALAAVAAMGLRNRVFLRLALKNVGRRRGRSALIVAGLMLGTAIIAAALATGDTMSHAIRGTAIATLGETDEMVSLKGADADLRPESGAPTGVSYFPESDADRVTRAVAGSPLVDGVAPAIIEQVAVQDAGSRQNEPRVTLFAADPARMEGLGTIRAGGAAVSLADLGPGEAYLNDDLAGELGARRGDGVHVLAGGRTASVRVREVVEYDGSGTDGAALLVPLDAAQRLLGRPGGVKHVLVSNRGGAISGAESTDAVMRALGPAVAPLGLEADAVKRDALEVADETGSMFMSFFTTFGSFSIAAGVLLIFLIFVMLSAERRAELGIARAVGTRRGHLVQGFLFEGFLYAVLAAAVGALVGLGVAYGMVAMLAGAFSASEDLEISFAVEPRSLLVAYAVGVLLTFVVVTFAAWRVSRMNIVTAIRNLPEPPAEKARRRHGIRAVAGVLLGGGLVVSGVSAGDAVALGFGVSLVLLSAVPLARLAGVPDRTARTVAGLALVTWFVLPISRWLLGDLRQDFSIFILSGLMIVVGASWTVMYNADVLLRGLSATLGRLPRLAPVLKMAAAYPLRSLFRSGVTMAMFTLVVFTLVVGATTTGAFGTAIDDLDRFGGGFDVRSTTSAASPVAGMAAAVRATPAGRDVTVVGSQSALPIDARQVGAGVADAPYVVRGLDSGFLRHTTYPLAARARGYGSARDVWSAVNERPGLAVVDAFAVPRRSNFNFAPPQDFMLSGFFVEDQGFAPVRVNVSDPQTGRRLDLTVIGVLSDAAPLTMAGISTSQRALQPTFGERVEPTVHLFALREGADARAAARTLESAFLVNGMEAEAMADVLDDVVGAQLTFTRIVQGFMGLGLIVGIAALGVITARSVVERRQQIGVLRAIGFRRRMVQASFLLESSFIALTSIAIGTVLGLAVAYNVLWESRQQPSWDNLTLAVPWANLGIIFLAVYVVALATTFAPALRASRVYPAEALRYQ